MRGFFWFLLLRDMDCSEKGAVCLPLSTSSRRPFLLTRMSLFSLSNPNSLSSLQIVPCSIKSTHPWVSSSQPQKEEERLGKLSGFLFLFVFRPFLTLRFFLKKKHQNQNQKDSCVFSHPHENARRRDPRTHAYVPEPCPDYRHAGLCLLGSACPFSHGGEKSFNISFLLFFLFFFYANALCRSLGRSFSKRGSGCSSTLSLYIFFLSGKCLSFSSRTVLSFSFCSHDQTTTTNKLKLDSTVYERHLHPSRYRTRPCAEGAHCSRRVCFFAHGSAELRAPTHDRMTASDAEAIRRTRLAAIAGDAAQPLALREQAAALYEGKAPPLASSSRGGGCGEQQQHLQHSQHHHPRSPSSSLFEGGSGSGDFSSSSSRGGGMASIPHSGPGTPLSTTSSMGGSGGGAAGAASGFSPFAPADFGEKTSSGSNNASSMLPHQQSVPSRFGPAMVAGGKGGEYASAATTQPSSAVSTPTAASVAAAAAAALNRTNNNNGPSSSSGGGAAAAAVEGPRMSMAVRRQLGMAPPSRTDSGVGGGSGFGTPRGNSSTATAPGSPSAAPHPPTGGGRHSVSSVIAAAAAAASALHHQQQNQQQQQAPSFASDASAAATAALLLSARPAGLRPVATSMPPSSRSQQLNQQQLPRSDGISGSGGSDASCGLSEAFGGSRGGSARMSSGCCSSGGSGSGGTSSGGASGLTALPPRAPPSASSSRQQQQGGMHPALKNVPVGRAGPSGDLGEAVARLGVRFSFMGDGGSE